MPIIFGLYVNGSSPSLAEHHYASPHSTPGTETGNRQKVLLAYLPSYLLDSAEGQRRERESGAGTVAPRFGQDDSRHLLTGAYSGQAGSAEQSSKHDSPKIN